MCSRRRLTILVYSSIFLCAHLAFAVLQRAVSPAPRTAEPNELGKVLILEYHLIQPEETRWGRSIANFRRDLEQLYDQGYRPVGMADYIDGKIGVPAGTRPVVITFDDSSDGQFRYLTNNGKPEIDPDCAVGILISFHKLHPDFDLKGAFFVLPGAKEPHKLFGQPEFEAQKLKELVALGFEIGNHTLWHADLAKYDPTVVQEQIALAAQAIEKMVPTFRVRALALPFGNYPQDLQLVRNGSYRGFSYHYDAVLRVTGGPARSPFSMQADLTHLPRIQVTGTDLTNWLEYFEKHPTEGFVSDGDANTVSFPRALLSEFNSSKFKNLRTVTYGPENQTAKASKIPNGL